MADTDKKVRVGIDLVKTGTGGTDAVSEIKKVEAAAGDSAKAVGKSGEANKEAAKHVREHGMQHRLMHRAMHAVNEIIPGLGAAMAFSFGAAYGAVTLLTQGVGLFHKWLEKIKEKLKEFGDTQAAVWKSTQDGAREAAKMEIEYAKAVADTLKHENALAVAEDKRAAVLKALNEEQAKLLAAREAAEMALAAGDTVKQAEIKARYKRKMTAEALEAERSEIGKKEFDLVEQEAKEEEAKAKADKAMAAKAADARKGSAAAVEAEEWMKVHGGDVSKAYSRDEAARISAGGKTPEQLRGEAEGFRGFNTETANELKAQAAEIENSNKALVKAKAAQEEHTKIIEDRKKTVADLATAESEATKEWQSAHKTAEATKAEIDKAQTVYDIHARTSATVTATEEADVLRKAGFPEGSPRGTALLRIVQAEETLAATKKMSEEQADMVRKAFAGIQSTGMATTMLNQLIQDMMNIQILQEDRIRELSAAQNRNTAYIQSSTRHTDTGPN